MSTATATKEAPSENTGLAVPPGEQNKKNVPLAKPGDEPKARGERKYRGTLGNNTALEQVSAVHFIEAIDGDTVAEITNPAYWSNVAQSLRPNDQIYVRMNDADNNRLLHLFVVDSSRLWAAVRIIGNHDFADEAQIALGLHMAEATNDFNVFHKGGTSRWVVERKSDKHILQKGLPDRGAANTWVTEYQKTLTR